MGLRRTFETGDPRRNVGLDPTIVREELPPALLPGRRVPSRPDVILPTTTATILSLVVPEVQILVPVDPMDAETTAESHCTYLCLEVDSRGGVNLSVGCANPMASPFRDDNLPTTPL